MKRNVYIVVPNWNGIDFIEVCLESLLAQSVKATVVVVDNGSGDGSDKLIKNRYKNVALIKKDRNYGFAGGVNIGIRYALKQSATHIALFNNDATADKNWLKKLLQTMQDKKAGIVTCKFMRDDRKHFDSTGDYYSTRGIPFPRGRNLIDKGQFDVVEEVFGGSGGASLYSAKMLKEVGLFDERFFAYYEDVDISFRARLAGWKVYYSPEAIAYHKVGGTSSKMGSFAHYHSTKNFYLLYLKNMPGKLVVRYLHSFLYQAVRSFVSSIIHLRIGSYIKAIFAALVHLPGILKDRLRIQRQRKISTSEIEKWLRIGKPDVAPEITSE